MDVLILDYEKDQDLKDLPWDVWSKAGIKLQRIDKIKKTVTLFTDNDWIFERCRKDFQV